MSDSLKDLNLVLMLSHDAGEKIADFFSSREHEKIVAIYFEEASAYSDRLCEKLGVSRDRAFYGRDVFTDTDHINWLREESVDFLITVYWPWLLGAEYRSVARDSVNFHPAFLPVNRGWYPHVHSMIDGSPFGVTLHRMNDRADEGEIWVQKQVSIPHFATAKEVYGTLQSEIVELFCNHWDEIALGVIEPTPQDQTRAVHHSKAEIAALDRVDLDAITGRELFDRLRARSFGNMGFAYVEAEGTKIFMNLRLGRERLFPDEG